MSVSQVFPSKDFVSSFPMLLLNRNLKGTTIRHTLGGRHPAPVDTYVIYPIIYKLLRYIPGGCLGFLPLTVCPYTSQQQRLQVAVRVYMVTSRRSRQLDDAKMQLQVFDQHRLLGILVVKTLTILCEGMKFDD